MRVCLLRHGRTAANDAHLYCGSTDLPLSDSGRRALIELRERGIYAGLTDFCAYTTGMRRTEETFCILFGNTPHGVLPAFREIDFGDFEMRSYDQMKSEPAYQQWIADSSGDAAPPHGESANAFHNRVIAAADALSRDSLIVCHGGVIAALMAHWFPAAHKNMYQWQPECGCGYLITLNEADRSYAPIR